MQSIGERLEEARKRKGISIREAAEATKIRSDYLHKFESNQFDIRLPEIYVRGFLRTYANYLKLPGDKIMSDYNALGLNAPAAQRNLNREVYGRMDLSISTAKPEKEGKEPAAAPAQPAAPAEPAAARNPATFVPNSGGGIQLDRGLMIKFGSIAAAALIGLFVLLWVLLRDDKPASAAVPPPSDATWVRPQAGEAIITLVAMDRAHVRVTQQSTGAVVFDGQIPRGDRRDVPRRGQLRVETENPERLRLNIGGSDFELKDPKTDTYLKSADIRAP
jgi:transcriptional regulator with XRE-family HTH domain